jgi:thiol-disulfide isomerase/thioredoxin
LFASRCEQGTDAMAQKRRPQIREADLRGFKYFKMLNPILERLHDDPRRAIALAIAGSISTNMPPCCCSTSSTPSSPASAASSKPARWTKCKNSSGFNAPPWDRFMQPGCGPCHSITPELNRLHDAGEVQVLVIHNGDPQSVQKWIKEHRPRFPVALQERFNLSKRYEVFATPFAFLIDEHGVIAARGIVSTKQYLGYVLTRAGQDEKEGADKEAEASAESQGSAADAGELSLSHSKEVDHV